MGLIYLLLYNVYSLQVALHITRCLFTIGHELLEDAASEPRHTAENADNTICTCADCALIAAHLFVCRFIVFSVTNSDVCQSAQPPLPFRLCY